MYPTSKFNRGTNPVLDLEEDVIHIYGKSEKTLPQFSFCQIKCISLQEETEINFAQVFLSAMTYPKVFSTDTSCATVLITPPWADVPELQSTPHC